jgi:hypothetical protein
MILRVRDFPSLVPTDFSAHVRKALLSECVTDCPVREDAIDRDAREVVAVITSERVDGLNTVLGANAFVRTLNRFMRNPICIPEHQRKLPSAHAPCVGSAQRVWREGERLLARVRFAETEAGKDRWLAYRDGHMRQFSIGFVDHEWQTLAGGVQKLISGTIRELSTVPVAANDDALVVSYVAGRLGALSARAADAGERKELNAAAGDLGKRLASLGKRIAAA